VNTLLATPELDDLTERFANMPVADQLEFAARVEAFLKLDYTLVEDDRLKQKETIVCLRSAMAHLGLERPLTVKEYQGAQKELALGWSSQQILRLWRSFELAARAAAGASLPRTWQYRDFQRKYLKGRPARTSEEHFAALRLWLTADPPTTTARSYDAFAREHNLSLSGGARPLPIASTVMGALGLPFSQLVAVARGETQFPNAVARARDEHDWSRGPHDLIGVGSVALMAGRTLAEARRLALQVGFPSAPLLIRGRRIWLRDEVAAYLGGEPQPYREADYLRPFYLTSTETADLLSISHQSLQRADKFPQPIAKVGRDYLWWREEVEAYAAAHELEIERRRQRKTPKGRRSEFVTQAALGRELGMSVYQLGRLVSEDGFPEPVRRFGDGALWLRKTIEAYLAGKPFDREQSALASLLLSSDEIEELLALRLGNHKKRYPDLPEPVARTRDGYVYLRSEVEEMLETRPGARERLERRRARRLQEASSSSSQATTSSGDG
jgi:predicted DNA-binding transcriptional regulator AlpA